MSPMCTSTTLPRLKPARAALYAVLCLAITPLGTPAEARAPFDCSVSQAAGKPAPPKPRPHDANSFRILWHVATQIEDLADAAADPKAMADVREAQKLVDGYYFNALMAGSLIYWPGRPKTCQVNFKRVDAGSTMDIGGEDVTFSQGGAAARDACKTQQDAFLAKQPPDTDTPGEIQASALERVAKVLNLRSEQKNGKEVWGENIIRSGDFSYDQASDKVKLKKLPATYCALNALGVTLNDMMIYQEPGVQANQGNLLQIPRKARNGILALSKNPRKDKIPENTHALALIADSFGDAGLPPSGIRVNVRRTPPPQAARIFGEIAAMPMIAGFNFEGGSSIADSEKRTLENYVENISWIVTNTGREISLLMPGFRPRDQVGNDAELDGRVPALKRMLLLMNSKLNEKLGLAAGKNALCDGRFVLIPASYGRPLHVKSLPMRRADGTLAGTVTGEIRMLADLRAELCGR